MDTTPFHIFGASHWAALLLSIGAAWLTVWLERRFPQTWGKWARFVLAGILLLAVAADPVVTYLRYRQQDPSLAARLVQETAWPFYLCDWAALVCAWALVTKNQRWAEIGWCWGLGGTLHGLTYPTSLSYDWPNPDWWAFFAEHGGVPVAAVLLVVGLRLRPAPGVVWRAWFWLLGYVAVAGAVNAGFIALGYPTANYGFVCSGDYSPFAFLGPWPQYVFGMVFALWVLFSLLTLPFLGRQAWVWPWSWSWK